MSLYSYVDGNGVTRYARRDYQPPSTTCQPDCPICHGVGYVRHEAERTDPLFGKLEPCPGLPLSKRLPYETYGIAEREIDLSWSNLMDRGDTKAAAWAVSEALTRGYGMVYLWSGDEPENPGGNGLAKTLILKIAAASALREGKRAAYVNMASLVDDLRSAYDEKSPNVKAAEKLDFWTTIPILCIDEFNRLNETPFARERRFLLMDTRYTTGTRQETVTIIASNTDPKRQESYLFDRFQDGRFQIIRLTGKSARPGMDWSDKY
jgi:DNA replication protein DnaC